MYDWLRMQLHGCNPMNHFICGALSGVLSNIAVYPLEVTRTRMAMQGKMAKLKLSEIVRNTAKSEGGIRGFYKGGFTAMLGIVIYKGVGFTAYEFLKSANRERLLDSINFLHFSSGAIAGFFGQLVSYPIEVTKRRMQVIGSFESRAPTSSNSSFI